MSSNAKPSLYQRVLGDTFEKLPEPIQQLHCPAAISKFTGRGQIIAADNPIARCIAWCSGLPTRSSECTVLVSIECDGDGEIWRREFADHRFHSRLHAVGAQLIEKLGPHRISFVLQADAQGLCMRPVAWRTLGVPLPRFLWPRIEAVESVRDGLFHFSVTTAFPIIGRVVDYRGVLAATAEHN